MSKIGDEGIAEIGETLFTATESTVFAGMVI